MTMVQMGMFKNSSFKIMFFLGIINVAAVVINCGMTGYFCIIGAIFCTHPYWIYISGAFGTALWCATCMGCVTVAMNRCLEITSHELAEKLFSGWKTYLWLIPPTIYFWFCLLFSTPTIFSGYYCAFFGDPYIGMHDSPDQWYNDVQHTINNCSSLTTLCCLYFYLCVVIYRKTRKATVSNNKSFLEIQAPILIQAVSICLLNTLNAGMYVYIQFFSAPSF